MLENTFTALAGTYSSDNELIRQLWREMAVAYSAPSRHYHNLSHLGNLLHQLETVSELIEDRDAVLFALFYHDAVYDALRPDNEDKSAELAVIRLRQLGVPAERIARCERHILATKGHTVSDDGDTNLFTDADLSILGAPWDAYAAYFQQIRREYAVFPDLTYNPGRAKVLEHFLAMPRIFKTGRFSTALEAQARKNLQKELDFLRT